MKTMNSIVIKKWNYKTKKYDEVNLPVGNYKTYSSDMKELVNCPHCYNLFEFGDGYTSLEFHTKIGLGYCVCETCFEKERETKNGN